MAEPQISQRLAQSRARRRDLDRPRISVHKGEVGLFSRLPNADPRNLLLAGGRLSQDFWYVVALEREAGCGSLTGTCVGTFDTWAKAMTVARALAPYMTRALAPYVQFPRRWITEFGARPAGVGEVPC